MQADFLDAQQRHWSDAEYLLQARRWANADHLYGIAAECGLKLLMRTFGMAVDSTTGSPTNKLDRMHANNVWARFESYRSGHAQGTGYALSSCNSFASWDIADRYANRANFGEARARGHQVGAQEVRDLISKAQLEGLI